MPQTIDNLSVTWANSLTTFTAFKFNAIDNASAAGSLLMDLQVGGSSRFNVDKAGNIRTGINGSGNYLSLGPTTTGDVTANSAGFQINGNAQVSLFFGGTELVRFNGSGSRTQMLATGAYSWGSSGVTGPDLFLTRRAAANLRLGAADAAGSAIAISSVASNQLTLASNHGLTTGAAIIITGSVAPSGTTLNVRYYARVIAAAVIELYSTYDQATAASGTTGRISVTTAGTTAFVSLSSPFQSFGVQDFTGTDIPGQPFIIRGSRGTGTGAGGDIIFQVAPAGTTGSSQNTLVTALYIRSDGAVLTNTINSNGNYYLGLQGGITGGGYWASGTDGALGASGGGLVVAANRDFCWSNTAFSPTAAVDLRLARDNANILALRNGANAQTFNVYKTFDGTVGGNNSYFTITANTGTGGIDIGPAKSGTGANLSLFIGASNSTGGIYLRANGYGNTGWYFSGSGSSQALLCETDNAYDIGASGANRPRSIYAGTSIEVNGYFQASDTGSFFFQNRSVIKSAANGDFTISNRNQTDFGRLNFGGTTSSFPALKRNSTALETKLADDSAYAPHAMQYLDVTDGITAPASATGRARIYVDTADGDLKVIFADGTVKTIVTDT